MADEAMGDGRVATGDVMCDGRGTVDGARQSSNRSCILDIRFVLTCDAATRGRAMVAVTSSETTMSCSSVCMPESTPSTLLMNKFVANATAGAAEMKPSVQQLLRL